MLSWRRLPGARRAVAGLEFALVLPLLLTMLAGAVDLTLASITARRLTIAATDVALIASTLAVQTATLGTLTGQQAWQATTAPFALFPQWTAANAAGFSITLSEVDFTASPAGCATACTSYAATTRWSAGNLRGQIVLRPCGALPSVANGGPSSMTTLPAGVFGPAAVLVGDVATVFTPLFSSVFTGPVAMLRSGYIPPRVNTAVTLSGAGPAQTVTCPATKAN